MLSASAEDYLKAIYKLQSRNDSVTTQALADRLGVAAASAIAMVKKPAALKLLRHTPYRGVELTQAGEKIALEVIRHHRLIGTYLAEVLGLDWDKVHAEAERWEHVISEEVEAKMAAALNHPTRDPHGAPIPTADGRINTDDWRRLSDAETGSHLVVRRVSDEDAEVLRHLREVGLVPDAEVEVVRSARSEGLLQLRVNGKPQVVGISPARAVFVTEQEGSSQPKKEETAQGETTNYESSYGSWKRARKRA